MSTSIDISEGRSPFCSYADSDAFPWLRTQGVAIFCLLLQTAVYLLVKPVSFDEAALDKISGDERDGYTKAKPVLLKLFKDNFEKDASKTNYFEHVSFDGVPDSGTLVLEPKLAMLDPGIRWVMPGRGSMFCNLKDGVTGKNIRSYNVSRSVSRPLTSTMMGAIETLISEMGEDAASNIAEARL